MSGILLITVATNWLIASATKVVCNKIYHREFILYRSEHFIIINKPPDMRINSNDPTQRTVQTLLKARCPELVNTSLTHEFYFVHRLDYATSGIMCIPLYKNACKATSVAFAHRVTRKYYIALLRGHVAQELIDVDVPIGDISNMKMCTIVDKNCVKPRNARTIILVLEWGIYENYPATKVLIRLITGRKHQIRVHCSHIGHTIIGDYTYSNKKDIKPDRMFLHSLRLVIPTPMEDLDLHTADPFTSTKIKGWSPFKCINSVDQNSLIKLS